MEPKTILLQKKTCTPVNLNYLFKCKKLYLKFKLAYSVRNNHNCIGFSIFSSCSFVDKRDPISFVFPDDFLLENHLHMKAGSNAELTVIKKLSSGKAVFPPALLYCYHLVSN